ncbi:MAG: aminodeoxychorismate/anthranilate synthase component II [Nanoarchaeota archaeon]|nr:aminodeoxychorismate/anthranilate synthase component II [Nanoarchaeota archaeon]
MKILIIDNYDSFTFNLYQCVGEILLDTGGKFKLDVLRNNDITIQEIKKRRYDKIIISPGPGDPGNPLYFGVCADVLVRLGAKTPILGVCLGMQGMAHCFGGKVIRATRPMHGKTSVIKHDGSGVFRGLPQHMEVMRYHSLVVEKATVPDCFKITAHTRDTEEIMGLRHKTYPMEGVQFHPESFATDCGKSLLMNFVTPWTRQTS